MTDWRERRLGARARRRPNRRDKASGPAPAGAEARPMIFILGPAARSHSAAALETLAQLAGTASSEHVRVAAAIAILDRGHGKPLTGAQAMERLEDDDEDEDDG